MPAYNLWLLMVENYCPAPAMFDRRVFDAGGVRYPEEIVVGHEDWDLILQLGGRGVHGIHAAGPTFLYRRLGFSRVNAIDYGPHQFHDLVRKRHAVLYDAATEIKVEWAPAVSVLLLDGEEPWRAGGPGGDRGADLRRLRAAGELGADPAGARGRRPRRLAGDLAAGGARPGPRPLALRACPGRRRRARQPGLRRAADRRLRHPGQHPRRRLRRAAGAGRSGTGAAQPRRNARRRGRSASRSNATPPTTCRPSS